MKEKEIDGVKVVHEFHMFHHEWECDGYGWVTADGRIWLTNHGGLYESDIEEIIYKVDELTTAIIGMNKAIKLSLESSKE